MKEIMENEILSKEEIAMSLAITVSQMSKDPHTKVGSCLLSEDKEIISLGYNTIPKYWQGEFPWNRNASEVGEENTKYPYVIHSEANALNNYYGPKYKLENATIFVTLFPCQNCAKQIVESGIKRVVYKDDFYKDTIDNLCSKRLLTQCGVEYISFEELTKTEECELPVKMRLRLNI